MVFFVLNIGVHDYEHGSVSEMLILFSSAASLLKPSKAVPIGFGGYIGSSRIEGLDTQEADHIQGVSFNSHSFLYLSLYIIFCIMRRKN